ncbi:apolipoprotein N-acyltransferase [Terasakiella sp. A23]|uniref:apolipoprotein N-acyltransferase n=1 Tax=Terasakiella sp. FCG-A23 TaxID=3080561 RepID=UPI00295553C6|nr:apolipoprotein N-acyltransferase [Terasakiella sp. A23]MDV7337982.1 apolipoprotein N-acyltransferase [Terasakiella sp. A23]
MQNVLELGGYKRKLVLIALGLATVLALPPIYIFPLAFVGLSGLFLFLDRVETRKQAFVTGWMFGIGFFGGGLYWLTNAFLVHPDKHGWLIPLAVPALAVSIGVFIGFVTLLSHLFWSLRPKNDVVLGRIVLFAVAWTVIEWVRGWIFTGFPWNLIGTIWGFNDEVLQTASYVGAYGVSFLTVLAASLGAALYYTCKAQKGFALVAVFLLPGLMWTTGYLRLKDVVVEYHDGIVLRLVQPNISQKTKWDKNLKIKNFNTHLELSLAINKESALGRPTHIIWPETAVTFAANRDPNVLRAISSIVPKDGTILTGTPRMTPRGEKPFQVWNSMIAVDQNAAIVASYDKAHLVPFGEYLPLRKWNPIPKLTAGMVDFSAGEGLQTLQIGSLPAFSPLICYEIIFPNQVIDKKNRPQWLLNLTNDGWYGDSPGPYQHLISAQMRSIEEGIPLVRVANTGITTITDAYGRMQSSIPYGIEGVIDVQLPLALSNVPYGAQLRTAAWAVLLIVFFILGQVLVSLRVRR